MLKSGYSTNRGRWPQGAQLTWTPSDSAPTTWAHRPSLGPGMRGQGCICRPRWTTPSRALIPAANVF